MIDQFLKFVVRQIVNSLKLFWCQLLGGKAQQVKAALIVLGVLYPVGAHALDLRDYWPDLAVGRQLIIQERASQGTANWMGLTRRYVNRGQVLGHDVLRLEDFNGSGWLDAWELRDNGTQMLEVGDDFPSGHKVYEVGREFSWGGVQNVGDVIIRQIHVDVAASTDVASGPQNWGTESLTFEALLPSFTNPGGLTFSDVVVVRMFQSFCVTAQCAWPSGQATWITRHWFAPGKGIIQTEYLQNPSGPISPQRIDYAVGILETWETP